MPRHQGRQARPNRTLRLSAIAFALALALAAPTGAQAAEKGLQTDVTWGIAQSDVFRTFDNMKTVGTQWVRLDISWNQAEPSPGVYDPATMAMTDLAVSLARQAGIKMIMNISETPAWETGSTNVDTMPKNEADFANFVHFVTARYAGQIAAYEIWNEENFVRFWPSGPNPGQYAQMLMAAYPAVKSADPNAKVIFGGLSFNDYQYLEGVYAAQPKIGQYFDIMATHPYTYGAAPPEAITYDANGRMDEHSFPAYREVRATMLAHGDNKPIWFTEFGWATTTNGGTMGGVDQQTQADYLTRAYNYIQADPYVQVAFTYEFRNNYWEADADNWEDQLGLMTTNFTPKPSYYAFKNIGTTTTTTATTASAPTPAQAAPAPQPAPARTFVARPAPLTRLMPTSISITAFGAQALATSRRGVMASCPATIVGRIAGAVVGSVDVVFDQARRGGWRWARTVRAAVSRQGVFSVRAPCGLAPKVRAKAHYAATAGHAPSASGYVYLNGPAAA